MVDLKSTEEVQKVYELKKGEEISTK